MFGDVIKSRSNAISSEWVNVPSFVMRNRTRGTVVDIIEGTILKSESVTSIGSHDGSEQSTVGAATGSGGGFSATTKERLWPHAARINGNNTSKGVQTRRADAGM